MSRRGMIFGDTTDDGFPDDEPRRGGAGWQGPSSLAYLAPDDWCHVCANGCSYCEHSTSCDKRHISDPTWATDPLWLGWTPVDDETLDREAMARELIPRGLR